MLRHGATGPEDGEDEGDPARDRLLPVERALLGHEELLLVVDSPADNGAAVQVDRARRVVPPVHHHHRRDLRRAGHLLAGNSNVRYISFEVAGNSKAP